MDEPIGSFSPVQGVLSAIQVAWGPKRPQDTILRLNMQGPAIIYQTTALRTRMVQILNTPPSYGQSLIEGELLCFCP